MSVADFPYRAIPDAAIAAELHDQAKVIKAQLAEILKATVDIGRRLASGAETLGTVRPELVDAWLFSEFGWKARIADSFIDAALNYETRSSAFNPHAALELARVFAARSICANELVKSKRLVQALRQVIKGDVVFKRWPHGDARPRPSRARYRVFRRAIRKDLPEADELE